MKVPAQEEIMKALDLRQYTTKRLVRGMLLRTVSPRTVQSFRFRWWVVSSYFPRLVASRFVKRQPPVRTFGARSTQPDLAKQLQCVNTLAPTKMCWVMTKYGSDKGRLHKYTTVYWTLLKDHRNEPLQILELGLGSNNSDVPSNMGAFGAPGASLRGWRELFRNALVCGADVDRRILFKEDRIKTFYCNQLDRSSIRELWLQPELHRGADIIIEDGLHTLEANICFLEESLGYLRPGGIYITEDIMLNDSEEWYKQLETVYSKRYPTYEFAFVILPNKGRPSSNLLVVRRPAE